jgi:hypothetical protein
MDEGRMLTLVVLALAAPPRTEVPASTAEDDSVIVWVAARPETCNLKVARRVKVEVFVQNPDDWAGRCIAVSGYRHGRALFKSPSDARRKHSQWSSELDGRKVGIYGRREVLNAAPEASKRVVAVGIANTCERLSAGAVMVMGYCHYTGGPIIAIAEMRPR